MFIQPIPYSIDVSNHVGESIFFSILFPGVSTFIRTVSVPVSNARRLVLEVVNGKVDVHSDTAFARIFNIILGALLDR